MRDFNPQCFPTFCVGHLLTTDNAISLKTWGEFVQHRSTKFLKRCVFIWWSFLFFLVCPTIRWPFQFKNAYIPVRLLYWFINFTAVPFLGDILPETSISWFWTSSCPSNFFNGFFYFLSLFFYVRDTFLFTHCMKVSFTFSYVILNSGDTFFCILKLHSKVSCSSHLYQHISI